MDIDIKELIKAAAEGLDLSNYRGDVVGVKYVENEIGTVEDGGIGIQINLRVPEKKAEQSNPEQDASKEDNDNPSEEPEKPKEELNFFAPKKNLQELLRQTWFAEVRTDKKYDAAWTDSFIEALISSEYGEDIARQWAVKGAREKKKLLKAYVVGLLKDAGVLKGSYAAIATKMGIADETRQFSTYMSRGKKQPYADWVKENVER